MDWKRKTLTDLAVIFAVGGFLGFLAPFGIEPLPLYTRMFFWILVCLIGYAIYKPCMHWVDVYGAKVMPQYWLRLIVGTSLASIPATIALLFTNSLFFDFEVQWVAGSLALFPKVLLIGAAISGVSILKNLVEDQKQALAQSNQDNQTLQAKLNTDPFEQINNQLPMAKRGTLLSIETADHYLNITTDKGSHLILMRFKDALQQLQHAPGIQVHRSWWVAFDAIQSVEKANRKVQLNLTNGTTVPVSKTYLETLKAAGVK